MWIHLELQCRPRILTSKDLVHFSIEIIMMSIIKITLPFALLNGQGNNYVRTYIKSYNGFLYKRSINTNKLTLDFSEDIFRQPTFIYLDRQYGCPTCIWIARDSIPIATLG